MELDFVDWLRDRLPTSPRVRIGIGDDAALIELGGSELVTTADLLIDGVHFLSAEHEPERIGRKALAVNLSDLAAMACRPAGAVVSLSLPRDGVAGHTVRELAAKLIEGMLPLAEAFDCPIVGGDTNVGPGPLTLAVTAFGTPTKCGVVRRDGAHPGDAILVTGRLGGSLAAHHLDFLPRVTEALQLHATATLHAMMDLSDGLSLDLARLAKASGVGAIIDESALPLSEHAASSAAALSDGEDFELLLTLAASEADRLLEQSPLACGLTRIGEIIAGDAVQLRDAEGKLAPLVPRGYEH
ncbi:MAG: thiamine-phosphate kinase [Planctomycetota bacterium]